VRPGALAFAGIPSGGEDGFAERTDLDPAVMLWGEARLDSHGTTSHSEERYGSGITGAEYHRGTEDKETSADSVAKFPLQRQL
jgi:hypothetical protein